MALAKPRPQPNRWSTILRDGDTETIIGIQQREPYDGPPVLSVRNPKLAKNYRLEKVGKEIVAGMKRDKGGKWVHAHDYVRIEPDRNAIA